MCEMVLSYDRAVANTERISDLFDAIWDGDVARVRALIGREPADVNARMDDMTPLMQAVMLEDRSPECVECLLRAGADPHARTDEGYTAMHCAVDVDGEQSVETARRILGLLAEAGADLEAEQHWGWTPLMRAVLEGSLADVVPLIELGADPNRTYPAHSMPEFLRGWTLLEVPYATPDGPSYLRALLAGGADPHRRNASGLTAREAGEAKLASPEEDMEDEFLAGVRACVELLREAEAD